MNPWSIKGDNCMSILFLCSFTPPIPPDALQCSQLNTSPGESHPQSLFSYKKIK